MTSLGNVDGTCHNANAGTYGHECGRPATWIGVTPTGFPSGYCDRCKAFGTEASGVKEWFERPAFEARLVGIAGYFRDEPGAVSVDTTFGASLERAEVLGWADRYAATLEPLTDDEVAFLRHYRMFGSAVVSKAGAKRWTVWGAKLAGARRCYPTHREALERAGVVARELEVRARAVELAAVTA